MKTEHINWAWFLIPHAAQGKIFPTCNFFLEESTKSYIKITFFYQKVRDFPFLCHLIWPRWFNFLVHECLNLIRFCFNVPYALCIYTVEKNQWQKKILPNFLPTLFFWSMQPHVLYPDVFSSCWIIISNKYVIQVVLINHSWIYPTLQKGWEIE